MRSARIMWAAGMLAASGTLTAQSPRYAPQPDTLVLTTRNPFHMFYVRGADTLGNAVFARGVSHELWRARGDSIAIEISRRDLAYGSKDTKSALLVAPNGREYPQVGQFPPGLPTSLMPLPTSPLTPGLTWRDSSVVTRDTNGFAVRFEWVMNYRVQRIIDTLGSRVADVSAEGRYRMRDQYGDSLKQRQWIDVQGPDRETFLFDITRGRQVARTWDMKLRGWGGGRLPGDSTVTADSVPAGLDSKSFERLLPPSEYGIVGYRQQGRDTSLTVTVPDGGIVSLHVIDRSDDSVVSTHVRADGATTLERAVYAHGALVRYERAWADTALQGRRERITRSADSVIVTQLDGAREAYHFSVPAVAAGDVGHEELLVPLIMNLPRDGSPTAIAVFRPTFRRLDYADVSRRRIQGGWLVQLSWKRVTDGDDVWLLNDSGDLLFIEARSDEHTRRVPGQAVRAKEMTRLAEAVRKAP